MQQQTQLRSIVDGLLEQIQAYGIKDITACEYRVVCHKLLSYAQEKGDFFRNSNIKPQAMLGRTEQEVPWDMMQKSPPLLY
jgi:hypothetical protein